jgi:hypothetical protein
MAEIGVEVTGEVLAKIAGRIARTARPARDTR